LFGLNRAGKVLYVSAAVIAVAIFVLRQDVLPRAHFSDADEALFRAARHGDVAGIEQALASGANVADEAPIDRKTALFRAAVFGYADAVKVLLGHGADPAVRGTDGRTALEVVTDALGDEKDPQARHALEAVAALLRAAEPKR
jgi:hypothetical protein